MSDIEALSHVDLLEEFMSHLCGRKSDDSPAPYYAATSQRDEIAPDPDGYRR